MLFIFDMGGVVTTTSEKVRLCKKIGIEKEEFIELTNDIYESLNKGEISVKEFWSVFNSRSEKKGIEPVLTDYFKLYFHPQLNCETVKIIRQLRKKHRVVCGTNTIDPYYDIHLERGDYSYFDSTYSSNKIGKAKPDADFFKLIMEAENYTPEQTFFTDDLTVNIEAAAGLGINAFRFTDAKALLKNWKKYF